MFLSYRRVSAIVALALIGRAWGTAASEQSFDWLNIKPTQHLVFHDCFEKYQCARLDVPMDYNRTDGNGSRVAVAIIKYPARVPVTDKRYGGAILLNPGGPGGSGVGMIFGYGERIQKIADAPIDPSMHPPGNDVGKYFDIMSFDPRGVNNTTPQVVCFPDFASRESWARSMAAEGSMGSSNVAYATKWARLLSVTKSCTQRMDANTKEEDNLLEHVNTAPVVGDMVSIVEALGEWREAEAMRILAELSHPQNSADMAVERSWHDKPKKTQQVIYQTSFVADREAIMERTMWRKGEEKLLYWGFSYGSVLGATFAAMQPQRVGRVIIDGVVDSDDYYTADFKMNLNDADYVFSQFFYYCAVAGHPACMFVEKEGETAEELRKKFDMILADLIVQPKPVSMDDSREFAGPDIVTSSDLLTYARSSLYSPLKAWTKLAEVLHGLQYNNATLLSIIKNEQFAKKDSSCNGCEDPYSPFCQGPKLGEDPVMIASVWCSDGSPAPVTPEEFANTTLALLQEQSLLFGDIWAALRMQCIGWQVRAKWRYDGGFKDIHTNHPVFLIGTTGDPVCPMVNAYKMENSFVDSIALEQKSHGHCSISSPSACTANYVRQYFQTGELPPPGSTCDVDRLPFEPSQDVSATKLSLEEQELWQVVKQFDGLF